MPAKVVAGCALHSRGGRREHDDSAASAGGAPALGAVWPAEKSQAPAAFSMPRQECAQKHRGLWAAASMCQGSAWAHEYAHSRLGSGHPTYIVCEAVC